MIIELIAKLKGRKSFLIFYPFAARQLMTPATRNILSESRPLVG